MKLNEFNKKLKEEYEENEELKEKKLILKPKFYIPFLLSFASVLLIALIISINIINSDNKDVTNNTINYVSNVYKINNSNDLKNYDNNKVLEEISYTFKPSYELYENETAPGVTSGTGVDYSQTSSGKVNETSTNVRVTGIDEADIAKCDGKYIYYLYKSSSYLAYIVIYDLDGNIVSQMPLNYNNNKLKYTKATNYYSKKEVLTNYDLIIYENIIIVQTNLFTEILSFENNNLNTIYKTRYIKIIDSRLLNDDFYFITYFGSDNLADYSELYYDGYTNHVNAYRLYKYNLKTKEIKAIDFISSDSLCFYMDYDYIALASYQKFIKDYDVYSLTIITLFDINLNPIAVFKASGLLINNYAIDINNNYLRLVLTEVSSIKDEVNNLVIFDILNKERKSIIAKNLGIGYEKVKSVRFEDDTCFVVTFLQTDPLYKIDITDPLNPKIVAQLKVPGYSAYLHPIKVKDENYLLGLGYIVMFNKISLYKDLDNENIQIGSDYVIEGVYQSLFEDPHAFRIFTLNNNIYLGLNIKSYNYTLFEINVSDGSVTIYKEYETSSFTRSFIINNKIYIPTDNKLIIDEL